MTQARVDIGWNMGNTKDGEKSGQLHSILETILTDVRKGRLKRILIFVCLFEVDGEVPSCIFLLAHCTELDWKEGILAGVWVGVGRILVGGECVGKEHIHPGTALENGLSLIEGGKVGGRGICAPWEVARVSGAGSVWPGQGW